MMGLSSFVFADINLVGEGKVNADPDLAIVHVGVVTEDVKADVAMKNNAKVMSVLLDRLTITHKVDKKDLNTSNFNLSPKYVYKKDEELKLVGHTVSNTLTVKYRKLDSLGILLDDMVKNGATNINGVEFIISNMTDLLDEARRKAVADARRKAELYAKEFGVELDKVAHISETTLYIPRPGMADGLVRSSSSTPIVGGEKEIKVSINVIYLLNK